MALATRCPNCQAVFRVVSDQLKLRGGLVRCGACRHVFDAIGSLSYIEEAAMSASPPSSATPAPAAAASAPAAAAPTPAEPVRAQAAPDPASAEQRVAPPARDPMRELARTPGADAAAIVPQASDATVPSARRRLPAAIGELAPAAPTSEPTPPPDPLSVPTLLAPRPEDEEPASAPDRDETIAAKPATTESIEAKHEDAATEEAEAAAAERASDATAARSAGEPTDSSADTSTDTDAPMRRSRRPAATATDDEDTADAEAETDDVSFLKDTRPSRGFSIFYGGGSLVLAIVLLLQAAVLFRTELLTRWPELRPRLVDICELYGCSVGWPTRAELLAVVGTELQAVPGTDLLELTAVVRNRAAFRVALPAVEVTLTDTTNRTLARKVFAPVDYLASNGEPSTRINDGIGAGSDYIVRITFEARGLNAAGFVVYPFYL